MWLIHVKKYLVRAIIAFLHEKIALRTVLRVREFEPSLFEPGVYFNIKCIGKLPEPTNEFEWSLVFDTGKFERPKFDCINMRKMDLTTWPKHNQNQLFVIFFGLPYSICTTQYRVLEYGICSKISHTSCLPERPKQTGQTQIRLLLEKQSNQGLPCLLFSVFDKHFSCTPD